MKTNLKNIVVVCLTAAFVLGFSLWGILRPDETQSLSERRQLAAFPEVSWQSVSSGSFMTAFAQYSLDQFPLRDAFRTLKALTSRYVMARKDNNGVYLAQGHASRLDYPLDQASIPYAAGRFRYLYETYFSDSKVYLCIIPDKNYYLAAPNGYPAMDYDALFSQLRQQMDYARFINLTDTLTLDDFYRTDAHWRQEALPATAQVIASAMGTTLRGAYETVTLDAPFSGVYTGQSALPLQPDALLCLTNDTLSACRVYDYETESYLPMYDTALAAGRDPYEMYLSGSKSLLTIENPAAASEKELIVFRDSFGSSLAPLLAEGYSKLTLVDIRYLSPTVLDQFLTFHGQDVLFLYSTSVLNNSITLK